MMTVRYSRDELLNQLEAVLDAAGANPARWPESSRARLAAFIEGDEEAARLFAEAKAFDRLLNLARKDEPRPDIEARILERAAGLLQNPAPADAAISLEGEGGSNALPRITGRMPNRSPWMEMTLLAASLFLGLYIGLSGQAVSTLRSLNVLAFNESDAGLALSGSLFEPSGLHDKGRL